MLSVFCQVGLLFAGLQHASLYGQALGFPDNGLLHTSRIFDVRADLIILQNMKAISTQYSIFFSTLFLGLLLAGCSQAAQGNGVDALRAGAQAIEREQDRNNVLSAIATFSETDALQWFFNNSYGVAIFPTIGRGGMGVGGAHGRGWVFRQGQLTGESRMTQVTIGWQLGGQSYSQIIFFEDEAAYNNFTRGNFELGAQASAVALTAGATAAADTAGGGTAGASTNQRGTQVRREYFNGIGIFTVVRGGLMYEASVGGQKFTFRPR